MTKKYVSSLDLNNHPLINQIGEKLSSAPSSPVSGREYFDTALGAKYVYNGTSWVPTDASKLSGTIPNTALITNPLARANHTGTQTSSTISDLATVVKGYTLDSFAIPIANVNMNNYTLTNLNTNSNATGQVVEYSYFNTQLQNYNYSSISKTFFTNTGIIGGIIYDTRKDSDGGAWRKRCDDTSWYKETIYGTYRGECSSESVCRAILGATTNDFFHNTTNNNFYALNVTSGVTQIFRGKRSDFPELVVITWELNRVIIWDLTDPTIPMWAVFTSANGGVIYSSSVSSVSILNGYMLVGMSGNGGLSQVNFITDTIMYSNTATGTGYNYSTVSNRNYSTLSSSTYSGILLTGRSVQAIAMTVLSTSPFDSTTTLPKPTIYIGTSLGITRIADDDSMSNTLTLSFYNLFIDGLFIRASITQNNTILCSWYLTDTLPAGSSVTYLMTYWNKATYSSSSVPGIISGLNNVATNKILGTSLGISILKENPSTPASGMTAYITNLYNTGWMNGDIRGAWLADTVVETVSGTQLVPDPTLVSTTGLTINSPWSISGGVATASGGTSGGIFVTTPNLVIGKKYTATLTITAYTSGNLYMPYDGAGINISGRGAVGTYTRSFVASNTSLYLAYALAFIGSITAIYVTEGDIDHSVTSNTSVDNQQALTVIGTLTKSVVNTNAQLVAYTGFSASSYLMKTYSNTLDFGTGDFCIMAWIQGASVLSTNTICARESSGTTGFTFYKDTTTVSGKLVLRLNNIVYTATAGGIVDSNYHLAMAIRRSGYVEIWQDGVLVFTPAADSQNISDTTPNFTVGWNPITPLINSLVGLTLLRISATAPSTDQIAYIYETERKLFEVNALCCIVGTSSAVTAVNYDEMTDLIDVGTSYGRSTFKNLVLQSSEATTNGTPVTYNVYDGQRVTIGNTGAKYYSPVKYLRDELNRSAELKIQVGKNLVTTNFIATSSQTTFILGLGLTPKVVYINGVTKKLTTDYTIIYDGFRYSVVTTSGVSVSIPVSIISKRG